MKVFKLRNSWGFPCVQVATEIETTAIDEKRVNFLVFTHNPEDRYDRSHASKLAPELFRRGCADGSVFYIPGSVKDLIVLEIAQGDFPHRAKEAARLYLRGLEEERELEKQVEGELEAFDEFLKTRPSVDQIRRYLDFGEVSSFLPEVACGPIVPFTIAKTEDVIFHLPDLAEVGFDFGPQVGVVSLYQITDGIVKMLEEM